MPSPTSSCPRRKFGTKFEIRTLGPRFIPTLAAIGYGVGHLLEGFADRWGQLEFGRSTYENRRARRQGKLEIRRHTVRERLKVKLRQVKVTLRRIKHLPIPQQGRHLRLVLKRFYNY